MGRARAVALGLVAACQAASGLAAGRSEPTEPANHPAWPTVAASAEQLILRSLRDPEGAKLEWIQGFQWGSMKQVAGAREYGWVACGRVLTQSGADFRRRKKEVSVMVKPDGVILFDYSGRVHSSCWTRAYVAPNQGAETGRAG